MNTGNATIVLVIEPRRALLLQRLEKQGLDAGRAIQEGTYVGLDANKAISAMMVSGLPDPVRFFWGISGFIGADAAIRLGQLCDKLARTHEVDVLCAQPLNADPCVGTQKASLRIYPEHSTFHSR